MIAPVSATVTTTTASATAITLYAIPNADQQLQFLQRIQQLLTDASFTSTYKFALLLAITELSVEIGQDNGQPLAIPIWLLAEKTIELYWQQTLPYWTAQPDHNGIFWQNTSKQAAIINSVLSLRQAGCDSLAQARTHPEWASIVRQVGDTLKKMPIQYLQNINGQPLPFLYQPQLQKSPNNQGHHLILHSGVMYCLRQFQSIIQQLVRQKWITFIQKVAANQPILGDQHDLESFLFGTPRATLAQVEKILKPMQNHRCFFCHGTLQERGSAVDHFIPWSRYPRDTALNFVVAHSKCNNDKSDLLAAEPHLTHWLDRNSREGIEIHGHLNQLGFNGTADTSKHIAHWAYQHALQQSALLWVGVKSLEPIQSRVMGCF
ncbi:MAG: HNH endonuclease [Moraxellaceae bacterium]